jgi:hypothetical protein
MQYLLCRKKGEKRAFARSADARGRSQRKWNSEWAVSLKQSANEFKRPGRRRTSASNPRQGFETSYRRKINSPKRTTDHINQVENQLLTPDDELAFTASLGGGPGGQNVNTLTTI